MKTSRDKESIFTGVFVVGFLTVALIAVLYFGWAVIGLPFVPFDFFDALTRVLPGSFIRFGIGSMVTVIRALNIGPTSEVAKLAEQSMAVIGFLVAGVVAGSILFCLVRSSNRRRAWILGTAWGILLGVPAMLVSNMQGRTSSWGPWMSGIWVLLSFLAWAIVLGWAAKRLAVPSSG